MCDNILELMPYVYTVLMNFAKDPSSTYTEPDEQDDVSWWAWLLFGIGAALVVAAATVLTLGAFGIAAGGLVGAVLHGAAVGTLIGAGAGAAIGAGAGAIYAGVTGSDMLTSILTGGMTGFGIGAVIGAVIGGAVGGVKFNIRGFGPREAQVATKQALANSNKLGHIMQSKHNLPSDVNKVGSLMKKTLLKGKISVYKNGGANIATWTRRGSQITYKIIKGVVRISDFWII